MKSRTGPGRTLLLLTLALCLLAGAAGGETLKYRGVTVDRDAEKIDLGNLAVQNWDSFYAFLDQMPNLRQVDMYSTTITREVFDTLEARYPDVTFGCKLRIGPRRVRTDVTAFSTRLLDESKTASYAQCEMLRWCGDHLYGLDLGHNPIKKLDFLYELPELRVLIVAICKLTDITPIASLKHLEYLEIFHNDIEDLSPLSDLPYLMDLNIVKNRVTDLTPLYGLKGLRRLWIHLYDQGNKKAPDEETLASLREALPDCKIDAESTSTAGGWRTDPHYYVINRMFQERVYEPFADSKPENMPEPWRSEALGEAE